MTVTFWLVPMLNCKGKKLIRFRNTYLKQHLTLQIQNFWEGAGSKVKE
jgi:hypothetical protein